MAGSYNHCVNEKKEFIGTQLLDHMGDAYEALEEMYGMIWFLADMSHGMPEDAVELARLRYKEGLLKSPSKGQVRVTLTPGEIDEEGE